MTGTAYDAAYPPLDAILAKNPIYVDCYTDGDHAYSATDIAQIHAAGAGVKWNHERAVDQMSTAAGGTQAAQQGMAAMRAVGTPANNTVALFLDADESVAVGSAKWYGYIAGFTAANAVLRPAGFLVGFYGEGALADELTNRGLVQVKDWLSGSSSFPGYNRNDPNVGEYQLVGSDVVNTDKDVVTDAAHMGVWWPAGSPYLASTQSGDDMFELLRISDGPAPWPGQVWKLDADLTYMIDGNHVGQWSLSKLCVNTTPRDITYGQFQTYQDIVNAATDARNAKLAAAIVALAGGVAAVPAATAALVPAAAVDIGAVQSAAETGAGNALNGATFTASTKE